MDNIDHIPHKFFGIVEKCIKKWVKNPIYHNYIIDNCIISGGCITSELFNQGYNDIDIYFKNLKAAKLFLQSIGINENRYSIIEEKNQNPRIELKKDFKYHRSTVFVTKNSLTFDKSRCQFIFVHIGNAKYIMDNFDLNHNKAYIDGETKKLHFTLEAIKSLSNKTIVFSRDLKYPIRSLSRAIKYITKGFSLSLSEYLFIISKISENNLSAEEIVTEAILDENKCQEINKVLANFKLMGNKDSKAIELAINETKIPNKLLDIRS